MPTARLPLHSPLRCSVSSARPLPAPSSECPTFPTPALAESSRAELKAQSGERRKQPAPSESCDRSTASLSLASSIDSATDLRCSAPHSLTSLALRAAFAAAARSSSDDHRRHPSCNPHPSALSHSLLLPPVRHGLRQLHRSGHGSQIRRARASAHRDAATEKHSETRVHHCDQRATLSHAEWRK